MAKTLVLLLGMLGVVKCFLRSSMRLNPETGGFEDVVVVVSQEMSAASCPQILSNVKVRGGICEEY